MIQSHNVGCLHDINIGITSKLKRAIHINNGTNSYKLPQIHSPSPTAYFSKYNIGNEDYEIPDNPSNTTLELKYLAHTMKLMTLLS